MAFALDHAVKKGKERIIYVIPYTSIIEQTAKILGDIFGAENIVEHHSNLDPEKETQRSRLASENWDAPVELPQTFSSSNPYMRQNLAAAANFTTLSTVSSS